LSFEGQTNLTFDDCHQAIKKGDVVGLRRAIDLGEVDPNLSNRFSWTLLMMAALEGNTALAGLLLERGAAVNSVNDFGESALWLAAHKGHLPIVRLLLERGASPDVQPHGSSTLRGWLEVASGLPDAKIDSLIQLIDAAMRNNR
jgi:ankyrin repeat protein